MKKIVSIFWVFTSMCGNTAFAEVETDAAKLAQTINYLLAFVENSECKFIRNDKEHSAENAAAHMRKKYQYFKDKIKTPEDFIRLAATKSLITNKPYLVRLKNGKLVKSETWLLQALDVFQKEPN
ncbi:MAG: DUF5329 domain-containing protein [Deltaproteobacteria bacterium]|nr:DUF5329 domain-containing protein [Deltaproteobacteria bacterium]